MTLDLKRIDDFTIRASLSRWPRIIPTVHAATPIGAGFGSSRFSSASKAFCVLYAAEDFRTAFAEAVVRDRFVGKAKRYLYRSALEALSVTEIGSTASLNLLDFRGDAAYELGINTDAKGARSHAEGQRFADALHAETRLDGILFDSRLADQKCIAIFDRAFAKLVGTAPVELVTVRALADEIDRMGIVVRRRRAV